METSKLQHRSSTIGSWTLGGTPLPVESYYRGRGPELAWLLRDSHGGICGVILASSEESAMETAPALFPEASWDDVRDCCTPEEWTEYERDGTLPEGFLWDDGGTLRSEDLNGWRVDPLTDELCDALGITTDWTEEGAEIRDEIARALFVDAVAVWSDSAKLDRASVPDCPYHCEPGADWFDAVAEIATPDECTAAADEIMRADVVELLERWRSERGDEIGSFGTLYALQSLGHGSGLWELGESWRGVAPRRESPSLAERETVDEQHREEALWELGYLEDETTTEEIEALALHPRTIARMVELFDPLRVRVSFEIITAKSAELGDAEERGWTDETGRWFACPELAARWISEDGGRPEGNCIRAIDEPDYRQGTTEVRGYHAAPSDSSADPTDPTVRELSQALEERVIEALEEIRKEERARWARKG